MASLISSPKLNMINVDKAYSVLIKNSNRYWINKHRLGPQAALYTVNQHYTEWHRSIELYTGAPLLLSLRLKGVSKKLRDRTLYHWHYSWSNASYLETEIAQRTQMALCETILWSLWSENQILWFIQALDSRFLFMAHDLNWTRNNQSSQYYSQELWPQATVLSIQTADLLRKDFLANWMNEMLSHQFAPQLSVSKH